MENANSRQNIGGLFQRSKRRRKKAGRAAEGKSVGGMERKNWINP
jgi:hypothetical protein